MKRINSPSNLLTPTTVLGVAVLEFASAPISYGGPACVWAFLACRILGGIGAELASMSDVHHHNRPGEGVGNLAAWSHQVQEIQSSTNC